MSHGFQLFVVVATIFIITTVLRTQAQDVDEGGEPYPSQRKARVANMVDAKHSASTGGHRIVLAFEDDLMPEQFTLWVDQQMFDKVVTGDLFIFYYWPDGKVIKYTGPIKEDNE